MGATSKSLRDSSIPGTPGRESGFTLIELAFTTSLMAIVLGIAVPSFGRLNADMRARSTAEQLAGALRLARASAVTRNRPAAFVLADATPGADATANANGKSWLVKLLQPTSSRDTAAGADLVQAGTVALPDRMTLTGPAQVCFDPLGMQAAMPEGAQDAATACSPPGGDDGGPTSYLLSRAGSPRLVKVRVYRTGRVDICDATRERSRDPDGCR